MRHIDIEYVQHADRALHIESRDAQRAWAYTVLFQPLHFCSSPGRGKGHYAASLCASLSLHVSVCLCVSVSQYFYLSVCLCVCVSCVSVHASLPIQARHAVLAKDSCEGPLASVCIAS